MKIINTVLFGILVTILSGCFDMSDALSGNGEYLKNDNGLVADCQGNYLSMELEPSDADIFWKDNNLPRGTNNYVCKDYKAYLPNKVTDCNGNNIIKKYGSIDKFRLINNLPHYTTVAFICDGTSIKPSPAQLK